MCLAVLALQHVPGMPVLIAANRDEFHARPTETIHAWPGQPTIYAGRDLQAGGSWMGTTAAGRYALVTNYREVGAQRADAISRGELVEAYLRGTESAAQYAARVHAAGARYNGFNLIVGDLHTAWYCSNRDAGSPRRLAPGVHAVSNHLLDTPWPKLVRLKAAFAAVLEQGRGPFAARIPALYAALDDRTPAPDADLPRTGIPLERERLLSSPFIVSPDYGTRSSTLLAWHADGQGELHERSFAPDASILRETELRFTPAAR